MAYRFKRTQSVSENVKRIANREIGRAIDRLSCKDGNNREEAIHDVRQRLKKVRSLMRLVRTEPGSAYAEENGRLREAGRKLSPIRDADVLIATLDGLGIEDPAVVRLRQALMLHKQSVEEHSEWNAVRREVAASLVHFRDRIKHWRLAGHGFGMMEDGLEKYFRRGRKAMAKAKTHPAVQNLHEWRKRVKDHWYHVRLLEDLWPGVMQGYEKNLKDLEHALGDELNLALLEQWMAGALKVPAGKRVSDSIHAGRRQLRRQAVALGESVYQEKPHAMAKRFEDLWKQL